MSEQVIGPLAKAETLLVEAETALMSNGDVSLGPLQEQVDTACRALTSLPAAQARSFAPQLEALIRRLDTLIPQLEAGRDQIQGQLKETTTHRQAAAAYTKARG